MLAYGGFLKVIFMTTYCSISGRLLEIDAVNEPELLDINKDDRFDQLSMASATSSLSPKFCTAVYDYRVCLCTVVCIYSQARALVWVLKIIGSAQPKLSYSVYLELPYYKMCIEYFRDIY